MNQWSGSRGNDSYYSSTCKPCRWADEMWDTRSQGPCSQENVCRLPTMVTTPNFWGKNYVAETNWNTLKVSTLHVRTHWSMLCTFYQMAFLCVWPPSLYATMLLKMDPLFYQWPQIHQNVLFSGNLPTLGVHSWSYTCLTSKFMFGEADRKEYTIVFLVIIHFYYYYFILFLFNS